MPKPSTLTIHGIPNCDTVKKARVWLEAQGVAFRFHDFRADGLERAELERWVRALGWEKVLNKASTTFKELPEAKRAALDEASAIALMLEYPTIIKRPVLEWGGLVLTGFKPDVYAGALKRPR